MSSRRFISSVLARAYDLPSLHGALLISSFILLFNSIINIGVASFAGSRNFSTQALFMVIMTFFSTTGTVLGVLWPVGSDNLLWGVSFWMAIGAAATAGFICWKVARVHQPRWIGPISLHEMWDMMKYGTAMGGEYS